MMDLFRHYGWEARQALWGGAGVIDGRDAKVEKPQAAAGTGEVYATNSGANYHTATCRFVAKSKPPLAPAEGKGKGLEPCSMCKPGG